MHIIITSLCELCREEWNCSLLSLWGCSDCSFSWELGNLQRSREHRAVLELAVWVCESSQRCWILWSSWERSDRLSVPRVRAEALLCFVSLVWQQWGILGQRGRSWAYLKPTFVLPQSSSLFPQSHGSTWAQAPWAVPFSETNYSSIQGTRNISACASCSSEEGWEVGAPLWFTKGSSSTLKGNLSH